MKNKASFYRHAETLRSVLSISGSLLIALAGFSLFPLGVAVICSVGWLGLSAIGALPHLLGIQSSYLDGYFEAMSDFTTTGITMYTGLDTMP
ncbi:MAG: hypothetical protein WCA08_20120 [Desulfoferrobacter sp.]